MPFQLDSPMYYTYVLLSLKDGNWYTGAASEPPYRLFRWKASGVRFPRRGTGDLRERLREHREGEVVSTRFRRPLGLIY